YRTAHIPFLVPPDDGSRKLHEKDVGWWGRQFRRPVGPRESKMAGETACPTVRNPSSPGFSTSGAGVKQSKKIASVSHASFFRAGPMLPGSMMAGWRRPRKYNSAAQT